MRTKPHSPRLQLNHPLAQGLVLCHVFHEKGGNETFDLSCYKANGAKTFLIQPEIGEMGSFYDMTGESSIVPVHARLQRAAITVAVWAKWTALNDDVNMFCGQWGTGAGKRMLLGLEFDTAISNPIMQVSSGPVASAAAANGYNDGEWHLIVGTAYSGGPVMLYVDVDTEVITGGTAGDSSGRGNDYYIGGYEGGPTFAGDMASCMQWDRVLTQSEIASLYSDPWAMVTPRHRAVAKPPVAPPVPGPGTYLDQPVNTLLRM